MVKVRTVTVAEAFNAVSAALATWERDSDAWDGDAERVHYRLVSARDDLAAAVAMITADALAGDDDDEVTA